MIFRLRYVAAVILFWVFGLASAHATWNKIYQFSFANPGRVSACYFFNADTGLIAFHCQNQEFKVLRTTDGGATWNPVVAPVIGGGAGFVWFNEFWFKNKLEGWAAFKATGTSVGGGVWHTTDAGLTWTQTSYSNESMTVWQTSSALIVAGNTTGINFSTNNGATFDIPIGNKRNALAFADDKHGVCSGYFGSTFMTTADGGMNWGGSSTNLTNECWGLYALRQSTGTYVCVDEDGHNYSTPSTVYRSDDYGKTWNAINLLPVQIMGDIAGEDSTLYVQNTGYIKGTAPGLYRSTDLGQTWTAIGGPNQSFDARIGLAPNTCGQIIYAFDSTGGVWKTTDGGDGFLPGGPGSITISPSSLFDLDTLYCGDTISRTLDIQEIGCRAPKATSFTFTGANAQSYSISIDTSVRVNFFPRQAGPSIATLQIAISDGSTQTVQLGGYMRAVHPPLSIQTSDQKTDSIGGEVSVPITPVGLHKAVDITVVMHYAGDLDYLGSFDASKNKLDLPNEEWYGRSKLYIANATPNAVDGHSIFNVFTDSSFSPTVTYDSLQIVYDAACPYVYNGPAVSTLQGPAVCGSEVLSKFMRTSSILVSIWPNPTNGDVELSSKQNLGAVTITLRNALGATLCTTQAQLLKDQRVHLSLPQTSGLYDVDVERDGHHNHQRVIRER
jgi:photosystem II stability/assembly factor-like uncharacterized protein